MIEMILMQTGPRRILTAIEAGVTTFPLVAVLVGSRARTRCSRLVLLALSYVNVSRDLLSVDVMVGIGIAAAVVAYTGLRIVERGRDR
jgi:hypothetical protein